jgi:uncharacterized protein (DUF2141 family)
MCAIRGRPGGGPVDKIPPEIVSVFPQSDSTNIQDLKRIEIYFSERMDEASVEQAIFISPPLNFESDWSGGDELTLRLSDSLMRDRTYVVTIGSASMDSRRNKLKKSFQFAFSTGSKIDMGKIAGKVYGIKPQDNFYIYAYQVIDPDSLNPTRSKADFMSQPADDGSFLLNYLSLGEYRVFVVEDVNKNLLLDSEFERLGIPHTDVYLDSLSSSVQELNFRITRVDTTAPTVTGARAINNNRVILRMSEPLKTLTANMVSITDTLYRDTLSILAWAKNKEELGQYFLFTANQTPDFTYRISLHHLSDTLGNYQSESQSVDFVGTGQIDTTKFELVNFAPKDSATKLPLNTSINMQFSLPVDTMSILSAFVCRTAENDTITGNWRWDNLMNGSFQPLLKFQPGEEYRYQILNGLIYSLWGDTLSDSTVISTFFLLSADDYGSLSGQFIVQRPLTYNVYIDILPLNKSFSAQRIMIDEQKRFRISWLPEGQYQIGVFLDLDGNRKYTMGRLFPFQHSEPFTVTSDTIKIRKRWEVADIPVSIPGVN